MIRLGMRLVVGLIILTAAVFPTVSWGQYGSLGVAKTPAVITTPSTTSGTYPGVVVVAQNTTAPAAVPAVITPVTTPASVTPPPTVIDPYSTSSNSTTLFAQSGIDTLLPKTYQTAKRFRDRTSLDVFYLAPTSSIKSLSVVDLDVRCQFAVPLKFFPADASTGFSLPYLYLAPGGTFSWWKADQYSPVGESKNLFAAYLDTGIQPQLNNDLKFDAWVRVGVFSDFHKITNRSVRVMGRLMGSFTISKEWEGTLGIVYINRERVKLLPAGGLIWRPNDDTVVRLVFPDPKVSKRIRATGTMDFWIYAQAGYGGGVWTMRDAYGVSEATDLNDVRVGVGLEIESRSLIGGFFEFGGAFSRELYRHGPTTANLDNSWYLRAGLVF